jgi:hypothetical protein
MKGGGENLCERAVSVDRIARMLCDVQLPSPELSRLQRVVSKWNGRLSWKVRNASMLRESSLRGRLALLLRLILL